jgi:N-methylhydantoinase A/oxoprolinase/acetone carboxylase beta subunit
MRRALVSHGALLTYFILKVYQKVSSCFSPSSQSDFAKLSRSALARYLTTIFTFLASAVMHVLACARIERCMIVPQLWLHLGTAAAVVVEDVSMGVYQKIKTSMTKDLNKRHKIIRRLAAERAEATSAQRSPSVEVRDRARKSSKKEQESDTVSVSSNQKEQFKTQQPSMYWRAVGFIWVGAFWTWAASNLMYSIYSC